MMNYPTCFVAATLLVFSASAYSVPIQLSETEFLNQSSGLPMQVEDFEGFPLSTGAESNPFVFANGSYSDPLGGAGIVGDSQFCGTASDQCLSNFEIIGPKTFDALPTDTTFWGVAMSYLPPVGNDDDQFNVQVVGGSGILNTNFFSSATPFIGFYDALGISSVTVENLGTGGVNFSNYAFDDVKTAQGFANDVSEPFTLALMGLGLAGISYRRRQLKMA